MALNRVTLQGRIPFDLELKNGDDEKKAFLRFTISVQRNYKQEGEQYYPEDLIVCKAFGRQAQFISQYFSKGDHILLEGQIRRDDDYEKDGQTVRGQLYVLVDSVHFVGNRKTSEQNTDKSVAQPARTIATAAAAATTPLRQAVGATKTTTGLFASTTKKSPLIFAKK